MKARLPYILIFALTIAVYLPVFGHDFVVFDDNVYVTENPRVRSGLTRENVAWALTAGEAGFWQPLTWLSLMADCELYGLNPGGYHLTSVVLHALTALFLFAALRRLTSRKWPSAVVAVLFALHPLNVEAVAWVSSRKDVLCALFWMMTLWAYAAYGKEPSLRRYFPVLLFFLGALMSKAMAVTLPFVLLLLDFWPLGRLGERRDSQRLWARLFPVLAEKVPLFVLSAVVTIVTFHTEDKTGALYDYPLPVRLSNALISFVTYLRRMVWPSDLAVYYPHPGVVLLWPAVFSGLFILTVSLLVFHFRRRFPYLAVGWFWYLIVLLPVSGFVQIGGHAMADRYAYLSLVGPLAALVWGGWEMASFIRLRPAAVVSAFLVLTVALTVVTVRQISFWRDSATLFRRSLAVSGEHYLSRYNLGVFFKDKKHWDEAEDNLRRAVALLPGAYPAWNNLGGVLVVQGRLKEAERAFREAAALRADHAGARNNLGVLLYTQGRCGEAIAPLREAVKLQPDYANAHYYLGLALRCLGREEEARGHIQKAVAVNPAYAKGPPPLPARERR